MELIQRINNVMSIFKFHSQTKCLTIELMLGEFHEMKCLNAAASYNYCHFATSFVNFAC